MNADQITEEQWNAYFDRRAAGETMAQSAIYEMTKFELRNFYNDYVTPEMIEQDDLGRFREAVARYEALHIHTPDYLKLLNSKWVVFMAKERDLVDTLGTNPLRSMEGILLASGLLDEFGLRGDKIITKADLDPFLSFCNERRVTIERDLGVNLRNDRQRDPVKTLNLCLEQIGLRVACLGKMRSQDQSVYRYQLDAGCLSIMRQITERRKDKSRSTLPEVLQPPRAPSRKKPANDNGDSAEDFLPWMNLGDRAA
jgi:hypothetical protein